MSAVLKSPEPLLVPMLAQHLPTVLDIEKRAYSHPWSLTNFQDSLHAGYEARLLLVDDQPVGYYLAMRGVDEVHLLNITVAPAFQRRGWARWMLDALVAWSRSEGAQWLWPEARVSNRRAVEVYEAHGFRQVGRRKAYYPALLGQREDAVVMSLRL